MGEKMVRRVEAFTPSCLDSMAEMQRIPIDDDDGEQVEAGDPVVLTLGGAVADFTLAADADVMGWTAPAPA